MHTRAVRKAKCIRGSSDLSEGVIYDIYPMDIWNGGCMVGVVGIKPPISEGFFANRFVDVVEDFSTPPAADPVNHPAYYTNHPSGVEAITVTEHMGFCLGNAMKYIWRADLKGNAIEDLEKAAWYVQREIARRKAAA